MSAKMTPKQKSPALRLRYYTIAGVKPEGKKAILVNVASKGSQPGIWRLIDNSGP